MLLVILTVTFGPYPDADFWVAMILYPLTHLYFSLVDTRGIVIHFVSFLKFIVEAPFGSINDHVAMWLWQLKQDKCVADPCQVYAVWF